VSRYQKGKTNLDFTEARDSERQWRQLGHTQICTSLQTDNYASTPPLRPDALPATQPKVGTALRNGNENKTKYSKRKWQQDLMFLLQTLNSL